MQLLNRRNAVFLFGIITVRGNLLGCFNFDRTQNQKIYYCFSHFYFPVGVLGTIWNYQFFISVIPYYS